MAVGRGTASTALLGDMRSGNALGNAARPLVGDGVLSMRHLVKTNYSLLPQSDELNFLAAEQLKRNEGKGEKCALREIRPHCNSVDKTNLLRARR